MFRKSGYGNFANGNSGEGPFLQHIGNSCRLRPSAGSGQALVELAIFASIFLMIMGTLLSYGLRFVFQQQAEQEAFRKALRLVREVDSGGEQYRGSASYTVSKLGHIPDPSDPYGFGAGVRVGASASVTWDHAAQKVMGNSTNLPIAVMDFQGSINDSNVTSWDTKEFYLAGFARASDVSATALKRYEFIFGGVDVLQTDGSWGSKRGSPQTYCSTYFPPDPMFPNVPICKEFSYREIRYVDSCVSNLLDYDTCYEQSRKIVDDELCKVECDEQNQKMGTSLECAQICSPAGAITPPWYAAGATRAGTATSSNPKYNGLKLYNFLALNQIFSNGAVENLGPQPDSATNVTRNESFRRIENPTTITTQEDADWTQTATRPFVYNDNLGDPRNAAVDDSVGYDSGTVHQMNISIAQDVSETHHQTWTTTK